MGRQLQLNFTPLFVHGDAIRLQTLPFKNSQQLRDLRNQYRTQFAVTRRADQIVALPLAPDAMPIGEEKHVSAVEHASLIRPLLEQRLVSLLSANRRPVARYNPITTVGRTLPTGFLDADEHVHLQSRVLISIRFLNLQGSDLLGLLWDIEIQKTCATSLAVLSEHGVRLDGLVVERETPVEDTRMLPQRRLVGRVGGIADGKAGLSERFRNVEEWLPLDELYLEASPENIRHLLQHFTRSASGSAQGKIDEIGLYPDLPTTKTLRFPSFIVFSSALTAYANRKECAQGYRGLRSSGRSGQRRAPGRGIPRPGSSRS